MGCLNSKKKRGWYSWGAPQSTTDQPINTLISSSSGAGDYRGRINAILQRQSLLEPPSDPTTTHTNDNELINNNGNLKFRNQKRKDVKFEAPKEILVSYEIPKETVKVHMEVKDFGRLLEKGDILDFAGKVFVKQTFTIGETLGTPSKWRVFVQGRKQLDPSDSEGVKRFRFGLSRLTLKENTDPRTTLPVIASQKGTVQVYAVPATSAALTPLTSNVVLFEEKFKFKASVFEYGVIPGKRRTFSLPENIKEPVMNLQITSELVFENPKLPIKKFTKLTNRDGVLLDMATNFEQLLGNLGSDNWSPIGQPSHPFFSDVVTFRLKRVKNAADPPVTLKVHRGVLEAQSPVFQRMFQSPLQETRTGIVDLEDISPRAMEIILVYFYFSYLPPINLEGEEEGGSGLNPKWSQHFLEILNFAEKYQVDLLKRFCDLLIIKICTKENALDLFRIAKLYNLELATGDLVDYIKKYLEEVLDSDSR